MKFPVYLCKGIRTFDGKDERLVGEWVKRIELPIPPFVGLEVCVDSIEESKYNIIHHVWITPKGAVVCDLTQQLWGVGREGFDCPTEEDWQRTLDYETSGWIKVEDYEALEA